MTSPGWPKFQPPPFPWLNDRPGVSAQTRRKIIKIANKLYYQPNYAAKSLISKRSYTIGPIIYYIADPFYPEIAKGIEEKTNELCYSMLRMG